MARLRNLKGKLRWLRGRTVLIASASLLIGSTRASSAGDDLLNLYDAEAIVGCCEGGSFRGISEIESYWRPRLASASANAFEISEITTRPDGGTLDYRGYDGVPVRTHFRFTDAGNIRLTDCEPIKAVA